LARITPKSENGGLVDGKTSLSNMDPLATRSPSPTAVIEHSSPTFHKTLSKDVKVISNGRASTVTAESDNVSTGRVSDTKSQHAVDCGSSAGPSKTRSIASPREGIDDSPGRFPPNRRFSQSPEHFAEMSSINTSANTFDNIEVASSPQRTVSLSFHPETKSAVARNDTITEANTTFSGSSSPGAQERRRSEIIMRKTRINSQRRLSLGQAPQSHSEQEVAIIITQRSSDVFMNRSILPSSSSQAIRRASSDYPKGTTTISAMSPTNSLVSPTSTIDHKFSVAVDIGRTATDSIGNTLAESWKENAKTGPGHQRSSTAFSISNSHANTMTTTSHVEDKKILKPAKLAGQSASYTNIGKGSRSVRLKSGTIIIENKTGNQTKPFSVTEVAGTLYQHFRGDVMISYSRKTKKFVKKLVKALNEKGIYPWVDWQNIPAGLNWKEQIEMGIQKAYAVIAVLSKPFCRSQYCRDEIDIATQHGKLLVPVVCQDIDFKKVWPELARMNWTFMREKDNFEEGLEKLLRALHLDFDYVQRHAELCRKALEYKEKKIEGFVIKRRGSFSS